MRKEIFTNGTLYKGEEKTIAGFSATIFTFSETRWEDHLEGRALSGSSVKNKNIRFFQMDEDKAVEQPAGYLPAMGMWEAEYPSIIWGEFNKTLEVRYLRGYNDELLKLVLVDLSTNTVNDESLRSLVVDLGGCAEVFTFLRECKNYSCKGKDLYRILPKKGRVKMGSYSDPMGKCIEIDDKALPLYEGDKVFVEDTTIMLTIC